MSRRTGRPPAPTPASAPAERARRSWLGACSGTRARRKPEASGLRSDGGASARPGGPLRRGRPRRARPASSPTGRPCDGGRQRQAHGQIGSRIGDSHPADDRHVHVVGGQRHAGPALRARPAAGPGGRRRTRSPTGGGSAVGIGTTRAWISTSRGRCPSMDGNTTDPGVSRRADRPEIARRHRRPPPGRHRSSRTGPAPRSEPNRCLTDRSRRRAWWRSPSNDSTVSTRCSSTRGPARAPSLVTWPTRMVAGPTRLGRRPPADGRRPAPGPPTRATDSTSGSHTVWIESTTTTSGWICSIGSPDARQGRLAYQPQARDEGVEALGPAPHLGGRLLGRDQQSLAAVARHRRQRPGGEASTCRCPARPRAGSPNQGSARRRAPGRTRHPGRTG